MLGPPPRPKLDADVVQTASGAAERLVLPPVDSQPTAFAAARITFNAGRRLA
jgi:hypothetical protein